MIGRPHHPTEDRELAVIGRMRRHGQPELLLVFPDCSKRLVPESWTDAMPQPDAGPGTLGAATDLLALSVLPFLAAALRETGRAAANAGTCTLSSAVNVKPTERAFADPRPWPSAQSRRSRDRR
jgi:hypothetical protein